MASLFTPESSNASWRTGASLGHLLNGHEPISREVIFLSPSNLEEISTEFEEHPPDQVYSHRMYVHGTLNEVQVAHVAISND